MSLYNQKQVIYLISSPLSERDFNRFGIKNWINRDWKVNVFDFTFFLYPKFWKFINGDKLSCNFEGLKIFQNINEVLAVLKSLENKVVLKDSIISGHVQKGIMYEDRIKNEQLKFNAQQLWIEQLRKDNKKLKVKLRFIQITGTAIVGGLAYLYITK